ncbi:MAG TPA: hypothetical protein VHE10_02780 [Candidatus Paceibacterota bacterium]|nr:hypothetical protein [Candidatus Paceibacterota bacterium]
MNEDNSTTNAILVILIVIVVGFIVWFVMSRPSAAPANNDQTPAIQVNLPGSSTDGSPSAQ